VKRRSLEVAANSGSMKLPLTRVKEVQSMRRASLRGKKKECDDFDKFGGRGSTE
jgi:hypothetical protein